MRIDFKDKNVLVLGLGVSGAASVRGLWELGANVYVYDSANEEKLSLRLEELSDVNAVYYLGREDFDVTIFDIAVKSPGIKYEIPVIQNLLRNNIKVISDTEAAYMVSKGKIVSVTGTNGKTTTTTLIGEIVKESCQKYKLTGNIGYGMFYDSLHGEDDEVLIAEVSSFQLAGTFDYKPYISIITNITPDHLDWHHTVENYVDCKFKNTANQDENDYAILNREDETIRQRSKSIKARKIFFSALNPLNEGIYIEDGDVIWNFGGEKTKIMAAREIFIPGRHNAENAMAAAAAAKALGIGNEVIAHVLRKFKGVEHRLEYAGEYDKVKFYNDSKGTNPDASIKAIEGIPSPIVLIAGGYDKQSRYDEFIETFKGKVKALILLGQTADDIEKCAREHGFTDIYRVENMDEAVRKSFELSEPGDNVVLSPACASWGMYENYEVRGRDFKERVKYYGGRHGQ